MRLASSLCTETILYEAMNLIFITLKRRTKAEARNDLAKLTMKKEKSVVKLKRHVEILYTALIRT
eukprot:8503583-Prorocentrum_lima.AAC.1